MSKQEVGAPHVVEENDMNEAQDDVNKPISSLRSEKKQTAVKDAVIEDLRYKIQILDGEIEDKKSENGKYIAETRKLRAETIALKTENKILERQVETVNESNKRLHNELHELRNKLRLQEAKIGELRVQSSEAFRNYQRSLQTSVDKGTRLRYFLQQLQNEIQAQSAASGKFQIQKEALETLMHEDSEGDSRFWNHGSTSGREIWKSLDSKSGEERKSLQKDVESALIASLNRGPEGNVQVEKITTMIERIVTERVRSRLGQEKQTFARVSKIMQEAKHRIASLDNTESSYFEISQRLKDKIEAQLDALDLELTSLSNELRLAHKSRKEVEETPRSITMTSKEVAKVDDICFARRASQVERLDLESAIQSMERKTVDSTDSESPNDLEILSMKRKMAHVLEEKLMLSDKLIESQSNLFNIERLLERKSMENQKMEKELQEKERRIMATEENLLQERKQALNLKIGFGTPKKEVENARDAETQTDGKIRDRSHRVELKFVPGLQPTLTRKVETLRRELSLRRNSLPQLSKIVPLFNRVDKGVQTGDETNCGKRVRAARRFSLDITSSGHVKAERRISRRELTLVNRPDAFLHLRKSKDENSTLEVTPEETKQMLKQVTFEGGIKNNEISATEEMQEGKRLFDVTNSLKQAAQSGHGSLDELKRENDEWKRENGEQRVQIENLKEIVEGIRIKEAETKLDKDRLQSSNSQLKITVDNLKNQVSDTDKKLEDLKTRLREHNQTVSQNKQEELRSEQLQQQITELKTYIRDKDTALEQKWQEIATRDQQIKKIAQEKEILEMMIQDVLSPKRDDISNCEENENKALTEVQAKNVCVELPDEMFGRVHVEDLRKGLNEFKVQLRTLQVELELIQNENHNLENTVTQLRNDKRVQENELALLRNYIQEVETSVHDTQRTLKKNTELMEYKEKELREVVNDAVMNTRQMESLETNLRNALQERDSNLAGELIRAPS